jgi:hypothetical protein
MYKITIRVIATGARSEKTFSAKNHAQAFAKALEICKKWEAENPTLQAGSNLFSPSGNLLAQKFLNAVDGKVNKSGIKGA